MEACGSCTESERPSVAVTQITPTSLGCGRTSRNLPPLTRGSNQPWYLVEALSTMIVWLSPVVGCATARRRVENRRDNVLSIFWNSKEKNRERMGADGWRWLWKSREGSERDNGQDRRNESVCGQPSPSLLPGKTLGLSCRPANVSPSRKTP